MVLVSGIVCIYYNVIISWTLYFLFKSFAAVVPWKYCGNAWNTKNCALATSRVNCTETVANCTPVYGATLLNGTLYVGNETWQGINTTMMNVTYATCNNVSYWCNQSMVKEVKRSMPSEEFWE